MTHLTTHEDRVLNHLMEYGSITSLEAIKKYGNTRLSGTIFNLRQKGWNIVTNMIYVKTRYGKKVKVAEYKLKRRKAA